MGGPCLCDGVSVGPSTDNFAICQFEIDGTMFYSSEHAYQSLKMKKIEHRAKVVACVPKKRENGWDYGMRVWNMGQRYPPR